MQVSGTDAALAFFHDVGEDPVLVPQPSVKRHASQRQVKFLPTQYRSQNRLHRAQMPALLRDRVSVAVLHGDFDHRRAPTVEPKSMMRHGHLFEGRAQDLWSDPSETPAQLGIALPGCNTKAPANTQGTECHT